MNRFSLRLLGRLKTPLLVNLIAIIVSLPLYGQTGTFFNVLSPDGADPWITCHTDGYYYLISSKGGAILLQRSRSLSGIAAGETKVVWRPPADAPYSQNLWAPEIHRLDGKWYIYVAADDGDWMNHRIYALENPNDDPFKGEFVVKGKVFDPAADRWAIDGTIFNHDGQLYFVWSGLEGTENDFAILYIAPMSNPFTVSGPRIEISRPRFEWEKRGSDRRVNLPEVNEGPQILMRFGLIHIIYSASGSWTDDYCLGMLSAEASDDLLDPNSWQKSKQPVFRSGNGIHGPGHCCFVKSPDGMEDWIVYHCARFSGAGWDRQIRAQPFLWDRKKRPHFGRPADPNTPLNLPGGDPRHTRYEAEDGRLGGTARVSAHHDASGNAKVGHINTPESFVEFAVTAKSGGPYCLSMRSGNGMPDKTRADHQVFVNGFGAGRITYQNSDWDNWSNAFLAVELKKGSNVIRFSAGSGFAELDCLDVSSISIRPSALEEVVEVPCADQQSANE